jgi:trimeric autotransporter adhesin
MRNAIGRIAGRRLLLPLVAAVATAGLFTACGDDSGTPTEPAPGPSLQIIDGRTTGSPGFFFLSPIQPPLASYPGTFDGTRSPTIEVCRWSGTACIGAPVATFSRAGGTIAVDVTAQTYRADWNVTSLAAGDLHRIRVLENGVELGVADAQVPGPGQTAAGLTAQGIVPLGNASRLPIRFRLQNVPQTPQNQPPSVAISAPPNDAVVPSGTPITFTGTATDPEDGALSGSIVWRSNQVAAPLGTGASITATLAGGRHTITASITDAGGLTTTASIQVVVSIISVPSTLNVPYGGTASLPITLAEPAPAGGLTLSIATSAAGAVGVSTPTVTIPAGQQSANATLQGVAPGTATVTVSNVNYGSATSSVSTGANLNIAQTTVSFAQGRTEQITIELESNGADIAAPAGGIAVTLTSSNPACVVATSPVTIPAGLVSTTADLSYGGSATTPCTGQITASVAGLASIAGDVVNATVNAASGIAFSLSATRAGVGLRMALSTVLLSAPAPAGGVTITLTSSDASVLRVADNGASSVGAATVGLTVAAGGTSATFSIHGIAAGTGTITASAPGYATASTATITAAAATMDILGLTSPTTVLSLDDPFQARVGVVNAAGTAMQVEQEVRPGAGALTVTVTNSVASVAQLTTSGGSAQSRTVTIAEGQSRSATSVATGGIAFDPLAGGSTTVAVSAPGVASTAAGSQVVDVTAPTFTFSLSGTRVGEGLRASLSTLLLGAPAPAGGLTVTLTSSNAGVLLASDNGATSVGAGTATLTVAAGATSTTFYMHGVDGASGTATIAASAPGYTSASTATIAVAEATVDLIGLTSPTTVLSPDDPFQARIGVVNTTGNGIGIEQEVRPGAGALVVTLANGNAAVAQLTTAGGSAQTRTVTIPEGQSRSATSVATGGIAFDPLAGGSTTVSATAAGVLSTVASSQVVDVAAPGFTFSLSGTRVGVGLRASLSTLLLGAPAPAGGLIVTLTSSDAAALLASDNGATSVGTGTATLSIPAGSSSVTFYMHGAAPGTATITASATGYTSASTASIIVASATLDLIGLTSPTTVLSLDDPFQVRLGVVNAAGNGLGLEQDVRPGLGPLTITITNGSSAVGQLTTSAGSAQSRTVTVVEGEARSATTVAAGGIAFDPLAAGSTTVSATGPGILTTPATSQVVDVAPPTFTFSLSSTRVGAGLRAGLSTLLLGAPAPAGGLAVTLSSSNSAVLLVSDNGAATVGTGTAVLTLPAGTTSVTFYMHGADGASGTATLTASAPGFTNGTTSITVAAAGIDLIALLTPTTAGAADDVFQLRAGVVNAAGTAIQFEQDVRPGAPALVATVTNSAAGVAQLTTTAGSAQSRTVSIAPGQARSATTVAAGGIAFDPLAAGTTTVAATAGGGVIATAGASVVVTVNP